MVEEPRVCSILSEVTTQSQGSDLDLLKSQGRAEHDNAWHKSPGPWRLTNPLFFLVAQSIASHGHAEQPYLLRCQVWWAEVWPQGLSSFSQRGPGGKKRAAARRVQREGLLRTKRGELQLKQTHLHSARPAQLPPATAMTSRETARKNSHPSGVADTPYIP